MDPEAQLESFIVRFSDAVAARMRSARAEMRALLPGAVELVYDNYNALAVGYAPSERASTIVFSIAAYPRWVSLFLVGGPQLKDPEGLLRGSGGTMRHVVLDAPDRLQDPAVQDMICQALILASDPFDPAQPARTVIKSISARQRPRRP